MSRGRAASVQPSHCAACAAGGERITRFPSPYLPNPDSEAMVIQESHTQVLISTPTLQDREKVSELEAVMEKQKKKVEGESKTEVI